MSHFPAGPKHLAPNWYFFHTQSGLTSREWLSDMSRFPVGQKHLAANCTLVLRVVRTEVYIEDGG